MKALKLHTNGLVMPVELDLVNYKHTYQAMNAAIGSHLVDIIHAVNLPDHYCLVVDDEGLLADKPVVNVVASYLYGTADHGQPLCGDVLIMKDKWSDDGLETVGLDDSDFDVIRSIIFADDAVDGFDQVINKLIEITGGRFGND